MRPNLPLCILAGTLWTQTAFAQSSADLPTLPPPASPTPDAPSAAPGPPPSPAPAASTPGAPVAPSPGAAPTAPAPAAFPPPGSSPGAYLHDGFYLRFGIGPAYTALSGDGPAGATSLKGSGPAFTLAIGGTVASGVVLAGIWHASDTGADALGNAGVLGGPGQVVALTEEFGLLLDWYPDPQRGWHAGAAVGVGFVAANNTNTGDLFLGGDVTGSILGGYDWWIAPQWSLGILLAGTGATRTSLRDSGGVDSGYRFGAASLALEVEVLFH